MKKILCLLITGMFLASNVYGADINDWSRGTGVDVVEGTETISTLDDQITNYMQAPLEKALLKHITGCTITVTDDEVLTISAGNVVTTSATGIIRMRQNISTATVDNTAADVGGLDTGSVAADTWYYVYGIADADATTFTLILSTSATNPTNAAALYYRLIGCALTDSDSDWLKAYYFGAGNTVTVMLDIPINISTTLSVSSWTGGDNPVDCSSAMPSISTYGMFNIHGSGGALGGYGGSALRPNGSTSLANPTNVSTGNFLGGEAGATNINFGYRESATDSSQQIQHYDLANTTTVSIYVLGFEFIR